MWISVCEHYHFRARKRKKDISCKSERSIREVTLTCKQNKLRSRAKLTRQTNGINCSEENYSYTRKNNNLTQGRIPFLFKFRKLSFQEFRSYFPSVSRKSLLILILRYGQEFSLRSGVTDDSFERHVKYSRNYRLNSCNYWTPATSYTCESWITFNLWGKDSANREKYKINAFIFISEVQPIFAKQRMKVYHN